ncbi:hypothetical protein G9P44_000830 [Scheffersomyces stipitis]|nr:hypothetical protein G9P44_000830 [Scheffersomyces stipitis]
MLTALKPGLYGLFTGAVLPPIVTRFWLVPSINQEQFDDINRLKFQIDHMGWHIRELEERKGVTEDQIYVPDSYYQYGY